jgi:hypothetical protein
MPDHTPTSVYRYYDEWDTLIYVGITGRGVTRNREHNRDKEWWPFVARQEVDHFDTRDDAARRESALIAKYRPPFNTSQNPSAASTRAGYLAMRERVITGTPTQLAAQLRGRIPAQMTDGVVTIGPEYVALSRVLTLPSKIVHLSRQIGNVVGHVDNMSRRGLVAILHCTVRAEVANGPALVRYRMVSRKTRDGGPLFFLSGVTVELI